MPSSLPSSSDADFEHMFDLAPVSLWLEDYSALKQLFARWRSEGVQDIAEHVRNDPPACGSTAIASRSSR